MHRHLRRCERIAPTTSADQKALLEWTAALRKPPLESPSYRLAYEDLELLELDDLRPLCLQLELLKPERILREQAPILRTRHANKS